MKLFIVAALVTVAAAGRLEHLERSYLPPDQGSSQGRYASQSSFGSQGPSSFGSSGSHGLGGNGGLGGIGGLGGHGGLGGAGSNGGFGSGSFDTNGIESQGAGVRSSGSFGSAATSNQYLPPNHGPAGVNSAQFGGSLQGFSNGNGNGNGNGHQRPQYTPQSSFGGASQYAAAPSSQYGAPSSFGSQGHYQQGGSQQFGQGSSQFPAPSRQYSSQFPATSRQYLAPKSSSNYPQQSFDEETGYHY